MARNFRVYQKKRGNRRTGSKKLGGAGEAVFFAVSLLLGCGGLVLMSTTLLVPEWRANNEFVKVTCAARDTRVGHKKGDDGTLYRPEVQIEYEIDGETYRIWTCDIHTVRGGGYSTDDKAARKTVEQFEIGGNYFCYYDPADPSEAVLVRGSNWWVWLSFIVPISFVLIGGGGLIYTLLTWGKSAERQAVIAKQAANLGPFANGQSKLDVPYVPLGSKITDSPGTKLAFRLPIVGSNTWTLFTWLAICILWNAIVSFCGVIAVRGHARGDPDWLLTIFLILFAAIGVGLIAFFIRQLLVSARVGPTLVEVSDQPMYPGEPYRMFVSQTGRLKMNHLEMLLVCDEETTYREGTDTRTETCRVYEEPLLRQEEIHVGAGTPFEADFEVRVPLQAMHSFKSGHNEITWKILVKGSPAGWPQFERSFPVIVYPGRNGKNNT